MVFSLSIVPLHASYAEPGDYYKEHEDFFSDAPESYKDFLEKYDSEKKTVDCGRFEVTCHVYKLALESGISAFDFIKDLMAKTIIEPTQITNDPLYQSYKSGLAALANTMLAIFILFNATKFAVYRLGDASDTEGAANEKVLNFLVIAVVLFLYDDFVLWILQLQEALNKDIIGSINSGNMAQNMIANIMMGPGLFAILVILIVAILLIILMLQLFYRGAVVAILYIAGPVAIPTKLNDNYNFFDFWLKQFIASFITLALQLIAIAVGLQKMGEPPAFYGDTTNLFKGVAFFVAAMTIPGLLGQWGGSTGSTRAVASGAKTAIKVALMKRR